MNLEFRWAALQDIPRIKAFIEENYGADSLQASPGRFEALFAEHPGGFHVALCLNNDEPVAMRCYLPFLLSVGGETIAAAFPVDLVVATDFRRKGISTRFVVMAKERFRVTVSSGQSAGQTSVYGQTDSFKAADFSQAFCCTSFPGFKSGLKAFIRDLLSWSLLLGKGLSVSRMKVLSDDAGELEAVAGLLAQRFAHRVVGSCPDIDLLRWRYFNRCYRDCRLAQIDAAGIRGLVAYRNHGQQTELLDIFCAADDLARFLAAAVRVLPGSRITAVFAGPVLRAAFKKCGFLVRPYQAKLMVTAYSAELDAVLRASQWQIYPGDSDISLRYVAAEGGAS